MAKLQGGIADRAVASGLLSEADLASLRAELGSQSDEQKALDWLIERGLLTKWQAAQLKSGRAQNMVLGHYKLLAPLGAGGMGTVFRAADRRLGREVALKVLPPRAATPEAIGRFKREALAALQLHHEHVVASFELGQQGSIHFLVMELVNGPSLSAHLAKKKRLTVQETARIGQEVALALEHARQQGIIHRDIKPSNILLSREGRVKVADLGLAKFFGPQSLAGGAETRTGQFMGTIDYCSPEQAQDAKRADIRSDIYALGCTLYHCLTGKPPFPDGTEVERIMAHIELLPAAIRSKNPEVPPALAEIIERQMLAKQPADRFQTPAEAAEALAPWAKGEHGTAVNLWAALSGLEGLLDEAAPNAIQKPAAQRDRDTRPPHRRPAATLRGRAAANVGPKGVSVLARPLAWAAVVLLVLATVTTASLLWPKKKVDNPIAVANLVAEEASEAQATPGPHTKTSGIPPAAEPKRVADETASAGSAGPAEQPATAGDARRVSPAASPTKAASAANAIQSPASADLSQPGVTSVDSLAADKPSGPILTVKHGAVVRAVAVSADGLTMITGGEDKAARLWNADGLPRGAIQKHDQPVVTVRLSADAQYAMTAQYPKPLAQLWRFSPARVGRANRQEEPAAHVSKYLAFGLSENTTQMAALHAWGNGLKIESPRSWAGRSNLVPLAKRSTSTYWPNAFSPDLRLLAMGGNGDKQNRIEFWDTATGKLRGKLQFEPGDWTNSYVFQPDGRELAVAHGKPRLQIVNVPGGKTARDFALTETLLHITFNPRGDLLACVGRSGKVELRDAETGEVRGPKTDLSGAATAEFSPDGRRLFVGNRDGTATLWDLDALLVPDDKKAENADAQTSFPVKTLSNPTAAEETPEQAAAQPPTKPKLAVPRQLAPPNGAAFNHVPRKTTLRWAAVPGAAKYMVQVQYTVPGRKWDTDAKSFGIREAKQTEYQFEFIGAQPGRWRVWALSDTGEEGPKSGWRTFVYRR